MQTKNAMRRTRDYEIQVIPRFVPMSEEDVEEPVTIIAHLLVDARRREMREQLKEKRGKWE